MGCIGSRTVGGYRGGAGAGGGRLGPRRSLTPSPTAPRRPPAPAPAWLPHFPRARLSSALSPRASGAGRPPDCSAPSSPSSLLPPPSPRAAVPLHHLSSSLLSLLARPRARHLPALRLDPASPPAPFSPSISGAAPFQGPPAPASAPAPPPASVCLGCFAPTSFPLSCCLFLPFRPPPIRFVHVHLPSGAGAGCARYLGEENWVHARRKWGRAGLEERARGAGRRLGDLEPRTGVGSPLPGGWGRPAGGTGTSTCRRGLAGRGRLFIYLGLGAGTGAS